MYDIPSGKSTDLGQPVPNYSAIASLIFAPNGMVYATTGSWSLDAHLFRFDPDTPYDIVDLGVIIPGATELGALSLRDGYLYGGASDTGVVFRYSLDAGNVQTWSLGSLGIMGVDSLVANAPDGKIYGGGYSGYANARFFSLNPASGQALDLGAPVPGDSYIDTLLLAPDGKVYGGTSWAHGYLFSYDPSWGTFHIYGAPVWRDTEIMHMIVADDGRIVGGTGWSHGRLFRFDPLAHSMISPGTASSQAISPKLGVKTWVPSTPEVQAMAVTANGTVYASGYGYNGMARLARWIPGTAMMEDLGWPPGSPETIYALIAGANGLIYGGGGRWNGTPSFWSYDPWSGSFNYLPPDITDNDHVYALTQCPSGFIYGGTGGGTADDAKLFSYNPSTGAFAYFGPTLPGEDAVQALLCTPAGKVYGATSPNGHLFRLDFELKTIVDLGQPVPGATDIWALAWGADGRMYGGTAYPGALFAYDPQTNLSTIIGQPFPQDAGVYDAVAAADGLIYGVTGGVEGHLFSYDPAADLLLDRGRASTGDAYAYSVAARPDAGEIYVGTGYNYGEFVIYDTNYRFAWLGLDYAADVTGVTEVQVDVLDLAGNVLLADVAPGASLLSLPPVPAVQLRATLTTSDGTKSPALKEWSITWTEDPKLRIAPSGLSFIAVVGEPEPPPQTLELTNDSGGELPWSVAGVPGWLSVEPTAGDTPAILTATPLANGLPGGIYTATLVFSGPIACINCPVSVPVSLTVIDSPLLEVTPSALAFSVVEGATEVQTDTVTIANVGAHILTWTVTADAPWLTVEPGEGTAPPSAEITVSADPAGLGVGSHEATLLVSGPPNCINCPQIIPVQLEVRAETLRVYLPMVLKGAER